MGRINTNSNGFLFVLTASLASLILGILKAEAHMPWRMLMQLWSKKESKTWSEDEKKIYRKKEYKVILALWIVFTVGAIIYVIFFVK